MKKFTRILLGGAIALVAIPAAYIALVSRGKTKRKRDNSGKVIPDSIAEIKFLDVNGSKQGLIIRGVDSKKPVLLYIHGGPGAPEFPLADRSNKGLEEIFVVCYWEQRGSGLSYSTSIPDSTMTMKSFINDALSVTHYLRTRFDQEKIYILGHSWGSYLGAVLARDHPSLYKAFISTGQITNQFRSESISYRHILSIAREKGDRKAVKSLERIGPPPWYVSDDGIRKMVIQRKYVTKYGGTMKDKKKLSSALRGLLLCTEYKLSDKINYTKGVFFTVRNLLDTIMDADLFTEVPSVEIPVYFLQGTSDYQTVYSLAREYFEKLNAPLKQFYPFENSAHAPLFEEPEKFNAIMRMVVSELEKQKMKEMYQA
ncbi:MAG TPA: alpha/beta hydrolase [Bacteroidales bacterium]|nr:alpha/beta hydrolase [Bacteroidales bacterium]